MSDPNRDRPERSLTMRRIALGRARVFGLIGIVVGGLYTLLGITLLLTGGKPIYLLQLAVGLALLWIGISRFLAARKNLRRFEEENGPGAGKQ